MPDQDFEKAFASLAYAELEQKAPGLASYVIGYRRICSYLCRRRGSTT